jgi:hypothetical protein
MWTNKADLLAFILSNSLQIWFPLTKLSYYSCSRCLIRLLSSSLMEATLIISTTSRITKVQLTHFRNNLWCSMKKRVMKRRISKRLMSRTSKNQMKSRWSLGKISYQVTMKRQRTRDKWRYRNTHSMSRSIRKCSRW